MAAKRRVRLEQAIACKPMPVSFNEILEAFEFAGMGGGMFGEQRAFLCRRTGKIHQHAEFSDIEEFNDELPDDIEDDEKYIALPDKRELGLGKPLVLDFVRECLPNDFEEVRHIFSKKGAYPKFRTLLARRNAIDRWHEFESKATEQALRDWCEFNSIILVD